MKTWPIDRILEELPGLSYLDSDFLGQCRKQKKALTPVLHEIVKASNDLQKLNASTILLYFGEPDGTDGIIDCLNSSDQDLQERTLLRLSILPVSSADSPGKTVWHRKAVPLKKEQIYHNLKELLSNLNTKHGFLALKVLVHLDIPEAGALIKPLIHHPTRKIQEYVLVWWYAKHQLNGDALDVAESMLFDPKIKPGQNHRVIQALTRYCESDQPEISGKASSLLAQFISAYSETPGNMIANLIMDALRGLKKASCQEEYAVLEQVFSSNIQDFRRGVALKRLAEIDGVARLDQLQKALADPVLRGDAAEGIAGVASGLKDSRLINELIHYLRKENRSNVKSKLVKAILIVGGDEIAQDLLRLSGDMSRRDLMRVFWLAEEINPQIVIEKFLSTGIFPSLEPGKADQLISQYNENEDPYKFIFALLHHADSLVWFDCETSLAHPDYEKLIQHLLKIDRGLILAEEFSQQINPETGQTTVKIKSSSNTYQTTPSYYGDWYDVDTIVSFLNSILEDQGADERYILLHTGGQSCGITLAPEKKFRSIAGELKIPLEDSPRAAMRTGQEYERSVRAYINQGPVWFRKIRSIFDRFL